MSMIEVCSPLGRVPSRDIRGVRRAHVVPNAALGFVDNTKPNFDRLAHHLTVLLEGRYGARAREYVRKDKANVPAPPDAYDRIAATCDIAIVGAGD